MNFSPANRRDPLGRALLTSEMVPPSARDPCVFADDDGEHYIIAGVFDYRCAASGTWGTCACVITSAARSHSKASEHTEPPGLLFVASPSSG